MTMNRLGVLLLSLFGMYLLWNSVLHMQVLVHLLGSRSAVGAVLAAVPPILGGFFAGLAILRWRERLARALFGADDTAKIGSISLLDAQATAVSLFGAILLCTAIPELVRHVIWVPRPQFGQLALGTTGYPVGQYVADGLQLVVGLLLMARCKELARRFLPQPAVAEVSEVAS